MDKPITCKGWELLTESLEPVFQGSTHKDFRGNSSKIEGGIPPHKPDSQGFVYTSDGDRFYPSVFNMRWVEK